MLNITLYQRNANQNHYEVPSHAGQNGCYQKSLQTINAGEGTEKRELVPLTLLVVMQTNTATMENSMKILKKLEIELPYDPAIPLLVKHTEETRIERDTCTPMFTVYTMALFIIARTWKQPRCPSVDKWIRKLWYIYTIEYYSAIKRIHLNQF